LAVPILGRRRRTDTETKEELLKSALAVLRPGFEGDYTQKAVLEKVVSDPTKRDRVDQIAKAIQSGTTFNGQGNQVQRMLAMRPVRVDRVAERAALALGPSNSITPVDIELAMRRQGINWLQPFAPGTPLQPYYGYSREPRMRDYKPGYNISTETRQERIPFHTLKQLYENYDVAQICTRHALQSLRSMRPIFEPLNTCETNPTKELQEVKRRMRRPDGIRTLSNWLYMHGMDVWRYDAGTIYRQRDGAGNVTALRIVDGTLFAPLLEYYGDVPDGDAPAYIQFIMGVPWDWMKRSDLIYEPFWPQPESPYGTPPIETVLINANTDMRLQLYFMQFFTEGQVPEAFAIAPEDQSDPTSLAEWQEDYNSWTMNDQRERWGLRWLPFGTEIVPYKPQEFTPEVAEYVMRRTVAAFGMVPHDLGFTEDVNRSTGDTQMDVQFRISTLPLVGYYEDILNPVIQTTWGFPIQIRFDTGREREDRLMEARVHQIYVSIGAEGPTEVRSEVLGKPTNPEAIIPRFFDSNRRGPIPAEYLMAIAGTIDPRTGLPRPGSVRPRVYLPTGEKAQTGVLEMEDAAALDAGKTPPSLTMGQGTGTGTGGGSPKVPGPLPRAKAAKPKESSSGLTPGRRTAPNLPPTGQPGYGTNRSSGSPGIGLPGYGNRNLESRSSEARSIAKERQPTCAGILVLAEDTGRVLLVQRSIDNHSRARGQYEIPGGHLDGQDAWEAAQREWEEELGQDLPKGKRQGQWVSDAGDGTYTGFIYSIKHEDDIDLDDVPRDDDEVENASWFRPEDLPGNPITRVETESLDWSQLQEAKKDLARWRNQSRRRVAQGKMPRDFVDSLIPRDVHDLVWKQLQTASTREQVDGAFAKAGGVVPKAQPPALRTFHRRATALVSTYQAQIQQAIARSFPPAAVASALAVALGSAPSIAVPVGGAIGAQGAASVVGILKAAIFGAALAAVLAALYKDAYYAGAEEAAGVASGKLPPAVETEMDLPTGGLGYLLSQTAHTVQGINQTTIDAIAEIVHEGIATGLDRAEIAQQIDQYLDTPRRAQMIAETEYARAWHAAVMETYQHNGITQVAWLHQPGACPECMLNVAASPQPVSNPRWPSGPIPVHPWTRCAVVPYRGE
jgi:8-oxo-dGTP pyrophosphatase MutT (NUDIX family)